MTSDTVVKEGWLTKQGGIIKSWKNRWFVLYSDNRLNYYKTAYDKVPIDTISLSNMVQIPVIKNINNSYTIELSVEGRTYLLSAQTLDEANEWLSLFKDRTTEVARRNSIISATKRDNTLGSSGSSGINNNNSSNQPSPSLTSSQSNLSSPTLSSTQSINQSSSSSTFNLTSSNNTINNFNNNKNNMDMSDETVTMFDIKGLMCRHCEDLVIKMMNNARGVNNFEVLPDDDRLVVHGTLDINVNSIISNLESQGFIVSIASS